MNNNKKIVSFEIENLFPFYIDNVNIKFFDSLNQISNKKLINKILPKITKTLDDDELKKFIELDNLTKLEKVNLMLNLALKKIISKTGSYECDIFKIQGYDKFNEPMYIKNVERDKDIEIVSDNLSERRFNFIIETNSNSYLSSYIKKIRLSFYLDDENKILSGGFSLQSIDEKIIENNSISETLIVDNIYLSNLIRHYISKQLYPISLNNILEIVEEYTFSNNKNQLNKLNKNNKNQQSNWNFKNITTDDLKNNWTKLINKKYFDFKENLSLEQKKSISDNLFFSILITTMITLSLYEELKIYFTSEKPELILSILDRPSLIKEDPNQKPETDFFELAKFLKQNYFKSNKTNVKSKYKKIKKFQDVIDTIYEHQTNNEYESFGSTIPINTIQINDSDPFVSPKKTILESSNMKLYYLLITSPELFGINPNTSFFIEYKQLLRVIEKIKNSESISDTLKNQITNSHCEINNNYITYLTSSPSILIIKNEPVPLFSNYFWAEIYVQSRIWMRNDIEYDFNKIEIKKNSNFYKEKIRILENLSFDWYDEFYGLSEIKNIVKKIDETNNLKSSINILIAKLKQQDSINKKDIERRTMVIAFMVAIIIGLINFFGMVFTVLTVNDINSGLTPTNIAAISFTTFLAISLITMVSIFFVKSYKERKKK
ncbi:MPN338 family protein [Mycoplasmoides pirum]|uniref:MPN338 family protein n=1 Tax=Mycoplasmoides pirum TaxID=2122 RepID=UPI00069667E9|nr:hypothetical protein [Mycoplasmoides pirum]